MSIAEQLKEMGFAADKIEQAVSAAGGSIEQAMEWLLAHQDEPSTSSASVGAAPTCTSEKSDGTNAGQAAPAQSEGVLSMQCEDSQKLCPNEDASNTGNSNSSKGAEPVKPKSPGEVRAQLAALEAKIKENRRAREEKEKAEALEQERSRRTQGKEIVELRQKFEEDEIKRAAESRRREKEEDVIARKRVLEQIERDREERRQRQAGAAAVPLPVKAPAPITASVPTKNYDETRIQIRLTNGQILTQTFRVEECLAVVRCYVLTHRTDGDVPFQLITSFPKQVFTEDDMVKTLKDLKLVPSAVLILNKSDPLNRY